MPQARKPHPAEVAEREATARCVEFWSFYFGGFGRREGSRWATLAEAAADARAIEAQNRTTANPRGAMVYGFTPERLKVFIARELWPADLEGTTMDERLATMSLGELATCIEAVEGERPGKPNSKAAALKRLARGMAARSLDADEVLGAAGFAAADPEAEVEAPVRESEAAAEAIVAVVEPAAGEGTAGKASPGRLPKEGTKERTAYEMMTRPGGATNKELVEATGLRYSFAANGRRFAARYGMTFAASREDRTVRFTLS